MSRYSYPPGTTVGFVLDQATRLDSSRALFAWRTPERVADTIEEWAETLSVDGFLMRQMISPSSVDDFADLLVPEMQRRGIYREAYGAATLRENLFGTSSPRVLAAHPAARFRDFRPETGRH